MPSEIFAELEQKLDSLIEEVETLRLEISELKAVRDGLQREQAETEARLQQLLGKFARLDESAGL
jgi:FtsZ-binding cell division protein ZapB